MESILVGNLFVVSQIKSSEADRIRNLRNENPHRHPDIVNSLALIEKFVKSETEQEKLLENVFLVSKDCYTRHIQILSMISEVFYALVTLLIILGECPLVSRIMDEYLDSRYQVLKRPSKDPQIFHQQKQKANQTKNTASVLSS